MAAITETTRIPNAMTPSFGFFVLEDVFSLSILSFSNQQYSEASAPTNSR
jgi:hypothetical protein